MEVRRRKASWRTSMSFFPAVRKRESALVAEPISWRCWGVRARCTPHQCSWTRTAAAVRRRRWAGFSRSSGMSLTVKVVMGLLITEKARPPSPGAPGRWEGGRRRRRSVVVAAALDAASGTQGRLAVAAVDAGGRGRQAAAAGPGAQPFDLLG